MIKIGVPATSANLGPGFDVLGMALDLYNYFYFEDSEDFSDDDLVLRSYLYTFSQMGQDPIPVRISQEASISRNGGLGSSSTCVVAGVVAALVKMGYETIDKDLVLRLATRIEGHPDNVAPAILGGLVASKASGDEISHIEYEVSSDLRFFIIMPDFTVETSQARSVLPDRIGLEDGVSNVSSSLFLIRGLETGDMDLIREGLVDKFHENYRKDLVAGYDQLKEMVESIGGALYLSGSGSTMMAITDKGVNLDLVLDDYLTTYYPSYKFQKVRVSNRGFVIEKLDEFEEE